MITFHAPLPKPAPFDVQDALMINQTHAKRMAGAREQCKKLVAEYVHVCTLQADTTQARDTHGDFVVQLEAMRSMLTGQRLAKGAGPEAQRVYIVRSEWGREFYSRTHDAWNTVTQELAAMVTELAAVWALGIPEHSRHGPPQVYSDNTLIYAEPGIVLQRYPTYKAAKNYVNGLHAVSNAALSRVSVPYACAVEVLGTAFVGLSICPIKTATSTLTPAQEHLLDAIVSTLRLLRTSKNAAAPSLQTPEVLCGCGTDGRFYVLDATELPLRSDVLGNKQFASFPRREMLFGVAGITTSPSSPVDFAVKYRMRPVFEHLLGLTATAQQSLVSESFTTRAIHGNAVSITPYYGHVYSMLLDQERQFQSTHDVMSQQQSTVMRQQFTARKKKFELCRGILLTEAIARIVKRFVRETWRRLGQDQYVTKALAGIVRDEEADVEGAERALNSLFIATANNVISLCLPQRQGLAAHSSSAVGSPTIPTAPAGFTEREHDVFKELLFVANDVFLKRPLEKDHSVQFTGTLADVDYGRAAYCLGEQLGVSVTFDGKRIAIESNANVLEQFFNLDSTQGGPLRSEPVYTAVELPVCFKAASKAKLLDFAALQLRIAGKVSQEPKATPEALIMARFVHLLAADVTVAHRGSAASLDYDEVLASTTDKVVTQALPLFDLDVAYRKALLMSITEPAAGAKALGRFVEKSRAVVASPEDTVLFLAPRVVALCRLVEHSNSSVLLAMLHGAIDELNALSGYVAPNQRRKVVADPTKTTLRIGQCAHLYLPPLTILVRCVLQPDPSRPNNERVASAIQLSTLRRDVIVAIYGEESYEAGVAADNIGSICSNNKFDLERAEEEFEKAVAILAKVQPEGPAVFVTQNNLAFLYLRKAELMKRNLKGLNERDLNASRNRVRELLEASENLLRQVIDHEGSVAPLDFATACNNLANIMLFRTNYNEAAAFFERTLTATERYANPQDEPHCRLHAQKNLKVLARRRYMNAVLRIQMYVRRFVTKLRNRKAVLQTRAALVVQRIGRAYVARHTSALRYRFSAYHYWVRQPRVFMQKLPAAMRDLPLKRRCLEWDVAIDDAARLLQRTLIGHRTRAAAGRVLQFQRAYLRKHREDFTADADALRCKELTKGALAIKESYAHEQQYEAWNIQQRATKFEAFLIVQDIRRFETQQVLELLQEGEYSSRRAVQLEWGRLARDGLHHVQRQQMEDTETQARLAVCGDFYYTLHDLVHEFLRLEEAVAFEQNVASARSLDFIDLLEHRMRHVILRSYEMALRGIQLAFVMPRIGRGYLTRRGLAALRRLTNEETFHRELLDSEYHVTLSFADLNRRWEFVFHQWNETVARSKLAAQADAFWALEAPLPLCGAMKELKWRRSLLDQEETAYQRLLDLHERHWMLAAEREWRREYIRDCFIALWHDLVAMQEDAHHVITAQSAKEFRFALLASIDFATRYIAGHEARGRNALLLEEAHQWIDVEHSEAAGGAVAGEAAEWRVLTAMATQLRHQVNQNNLLRKAEDAARRTIGAYEHRGITNLASKLQLGERVIVELETERDLIVIEIQETIVREGLHRRALQPVLMRLAERHHLESLETVARHHVAELREIAVKEDLVQPMRDNLANVRARFTRRATHSKVRAAISSEEACEHLELVWHKRSLAILHSHMRTLDKLQRDFSREHIIAEESAVRAQLENSLQGSVASEFENIFLVMHRDAAADVLLQRAAVLAPVYQAREGEHRAVIEREEGSATLRRTLEVAEATTREAVLSAHEFDLMALFLMAMHHKWSTRLFIAQRNTLGTSVVSDAWKAINILRTRGAIELLQRAGRALSTRRAAQADRLRRFAASGLLQRAARGFLERRVLVFREAEEVEHCLLYASEAATREDIVYDEARSRNQIHLYGSLNPSRFLQSSQRRPATSHADKRSGLHTSPRAPRPPNGRIYAAPSWTTGSLFGQLHAARPAHPLQHMQQPAAGSPPGGFSATYGYK
jgi:hypothetical protein